MTENPGWKIKSPYEADSSDIKIEQVLSIPDIKDLPIKTNVIDKLIKTNFQWCVPCCSCAWWCNVVMVQNILDFRDDTVDVNFIELREKMWHKFDCVEDWDYIENFLKALKNHWVSWRVWWKQTVYKIWWYSYWAMPKKEEDLNILKYWIHKKWPVMFSTYWNKKLWDEMSAWEIKTLIPNSAVTWWHVLGWIIDYDDEKRMFQVLNTFKPNHINAKWKAISKFQMSYDYFLKAVNAWQFSWRYWVIYDNVDIDWTMIFPDFCPNETSEEYKAVTWAKQLWLIKWIKHTNWEFYLEPNTPITRLDLILILYRLNKNG